MQKKPVVAPKRASHTEVVRAILELLKWRLDVFAWKNNTGGVKVRDNGYLSFGNPGSSDILGLTSDGMFLGIEVKVGRDRQSVIQKSFEEKVKIFGGRYTIVDSVDATVKYLDSLGLPRLHAFEYFNKPIK